MFVVYVLCSERTRPSNPYRFTSYPRGVAACPRREGDDVCLVGASPALGNWDPSRALQLNTGRFCAHTTTSICPCLQPSEVVSECVRAQTQSERVSVRSRSPTASAGMSLGCRRRQLPTPLHCLQVPVFGRAGPRRLLWPMAQSAN